MKNVIQASLAIGALVLSLGLTACSSTGGDDAADYCDTAKKEFSVFADGDVSWMSEDRIAETAKAFATVGETATGDIKADYVLVADFMEKVAAAAGDSKTLSGMEADATKMQEAGDRIQKDLTSACSFTLGG